MNLSIVIIAKNEAGNIARCLEAVSWCDDVWVVDDFSNDQTGDIARNLGARVIQHRFEGFAKQRNWALRHAALRHPWVLLLDADEVVTEGLRRELEHALPNADAAVGGFLLCRKTMFLGRWLRYSDGFPVWILRLVRAGDACFVDAGHGEEPVPPVSGRLERLREPFLHYAFSKGLSQWIARHARYAELEAERELTEACPLSWRELVLGDRAARRRALRSLARRVPCRALLRFCYQFVLKRGMLDGRAGMAYSSLMAAYEGLIVLKRWELRERERFRGLPERDPAAAVGSHVPVVD
jgi:glycosyltransferase involved in cell wall biosynthesis